MNGDLSVSKVIFLVFLVICAIQDKKERSVEERIYIIFGILGITAALFMKRDIFYIAQAAVPGIILLILSKLSKEALGMGDAIFYIVAALYLNLAEIILMLVLSFVLCGVLGLVVMVFCSMENRSGRSVKLPYLTVLLPIGLLVLVGGF